MMKKVHAMNKILNMENWEKLQQSIAGATGMAIVTVDHRGKPITKHSGCCEFCINIRNDAVLGEFCERCDARGGMEGFRSNQPYIYRCHFSIIDIAIPIIVNDNYLGAVMAGQIRLSDSDIVNKLEQIYIHGNTIEAENKKKELAAYYELIPILPFKQLESAVRMLSDFCEYIIKETIYKSDDMHIEDYLLHMEAIDNIKNNYYEINYYDKKVDLEDNTKAIKLSGNKKVTSNRIILNALNYIYLNKEEFVPLTKMAEYCHVSSAYLSRLFTKEVGESYSSFVTRLKIEWSKELLENTDMTVTEISEKLGFNDPGYFIKIFKNNAGVTPAFYRAHCKNAV